MVKHWLILQVVSAGHFENTHHLLRSGVIGKHICRSQGLTDLSTGVGGGASALALAWGQAGGGSRAGGAGGKWLGLDPVVPVTSVDLMHSISSFYGCVHSSPPSDEMKCHNQYVLPC